MIDNLYEQIVVSDDKNANAKFTGMFAFSIISFFVAFVCFYLIFNVGFNWVFLINCLIFAGLGVYLFIKKDYMIKDYEYDFIAGSVDVCMIINNKKRKELVKFETAELEAIGQCSASCFDRYLKTPDTKSVVATFNRKRSETYFAFFRTEKGKVILIFEPDETLLISMKKYLKVRIEK